MMRRFVLAALLLGLCACGRGDDREPFTDSRIPPNLGPAFWPPQAWAWGLVQVDGSPPQRYGVGAPLDEPPVAQVLLMPGYGGVAEEDFQTASAFVDERMQVWTLDGVGQGGSGRIVAPRDLGHVDSFGGDVEGVRATLARVIRPAPETPLVAIADASAAPVLLRAAQTGLPGVTAIVLTEPRLRGRGLIPHAPAGPPWARWLHYGRYRAPGAGPWTRDAGKAEPGSRAYVRHAWQTANPDLRMGGPSLGWLAAFDELLAAMRAAGFRKLDLPVLILVDPKAPAGERDDAARLCRALPRCTLTSDAASDWSLREIAFVRAIAKADADPLETRALPNPRPGR